MHFKFSFVFIFLFCYCGIAFSDYLSFYVKHNPFSSGKIEYDGSWDLVAPLLASAWSLFMPNGTLFEKFYNNAPLRSALNYISVIGDIAELPRTRHPIFFLLIAGLDDKPNYYPLFDEKLYVNLTSGSFSSLNTSLDAVLTLKNERRLLLRVMDLLPLNWYPSAYFLAQATSSYVLNSTFPSYLPTEATSDGRFAKLLLHLNSSPSIEGVSGFKSNVSTVFKPQAVDPVGSFALTTSELDLFNSSIVTEELLLEFKAIYAWGGIFEPRGGAWTATELQTVEYFASGITKLQELKETNVTLYNLIKPIVIQKLLPKTVEYIGATMLKFGILTVLSVDRLPLLAATSTDSSKGRMQSLSSSGVGSHLSLEACFVSSSDCALKTKSCTGRGTCVQTLPASVGNCWQCACNTVNNVDYIGDACEYEDWSVSFALIAFILIVFLLVFSASLFFLQVVISSNPTALMGGYSSHLKTE